MSNFLREKEKFTAGGGTDKGNSGLIRFVTNLFLSSRRVVFLLFQILPVKINAPNLFLNSGRFI
jgi:hypothetical protein